MSACSGPFRVWDTYLLRAPVHGVRDELPLPPLPAADTRQAYLAVLSAARADRALVEAITLASPALAGLLTKIGDGDAGRVKTGKLRRAALAVLRYDLRRRCRPTPFGLFAGVSAGRFTERPDPADLPATGKLRARRTRTQADMQWLLAAVRDLEVAGGLPGCLRVRAHQALAVRGGRVVLDCASTFGAAPGERSRTTVSIRQTEPVALAIRLAGDPVTLDDLIRALVDRFGAAVRPMAQAMLDELIEQEILLTELRPPLDGGDPLDHVIEVLTRVAPGHPSLPDLIGVRAAIARYDEAPPGEGLAELYRAVAAADRVHIHATPLHVDTELNGGTELPAEVAREVARGMELMWRMSPAKRGLSGLRDYHARFLERYGADRLVPLLEVIDPDAGMGPPAGYGWPASDAVAAGADPAPDPARRRVLYRLLAESILDGTGEVVLDEETVLALCRNRPGHDDPAPSEVPNSCEVTVHVLAESAERLAGGDFLVALSPSPGSHHAGATSMRFSGLLGDHEQAVREHSRALPVQVEGAMRADIAFLPRSGKAANLAHTVPDTGRRIAVGLPDSTAEELRLADLAVGATLERMCLVHLPSGREVVPVLANMVSTAAQAPNVARLLWELGLEGQRLWEPWQWGELADAPFVPRIRYGRFILAPAVWRLDRLRDRAAEGEWAHALERWRRHYRVPRRVLVVSNDQRMMLDLDESWHAELLRDELTKDPGLVAQEIPGDEQGWCDGEVAGHLTEVVVGLERRDAAPGHVGTTAFADPRREVHGLGGPWLYLKLYGAARGQDDLIRNVVPELVNTARVHGADAWFFLRYTDGDGHHLRLRLRGRPEDMWSQAARSVGELLGRYERAGMLREHRVDRYDPELERYGGARLADQMTALFQADSEAAIELLSLARDPQCDHDLDALAAMSVASLAHAFGPPAGQPGLEAAEAWLSRTGTRRDLPRAYRAEPARWARLVDPAGGWAGMRGDVVGDKVLAALRRRDQVATDLRTRLDQLLADGDTYTSPGRLIGSLFHMTCNRLFGGDSERERRVVGLARGAVQDAANRRRHQR